ncbi:MAG: TonB-dependent receptor [Bryobacterales bacterium]|nr:TonB-dependent receptor [Bryobacterales bacterium]
MKRTPALMFLAATAAFAQGTGTIHGTVTDPAGLGVPGASVTAVLAERGTTRKVETNAQGSYVLPLLPIGAYEVSVEAQGFKVFRRSQIELTATENVRVDAQLALGSMAETVSVTAEAPLIDSRSSMIGTLIDSRRLPELPINGRNIIALASLLPGASQISAPQTFTGDRSGPTVSMSGGRGNQNLFLFDGAHFNAVFRNTGLNYPPPDALREVKVLSNSFTAEYGRNAGSIFNVVTRSGTNDLHASAWEFLRNHKLNARNFFAPSKKPQLIQNQFGATAGGPIRKDKLFIFGSWESLRVRPAALSTAAFPLTAAERGGDFSSSRTAVRDPLTGQAFPGNRIPSARFDPVAQKILDPQMVPLPNRPDGQLVTVSPEPQNNDQFLVRMDYNLGRHTLEGRYNYNLAKQRTSAGNVPTYLPLDTIAKVQSVTVGDMIVLRPNLLNEARLSFNRVRASVENLNPVHISQLGSKFPIFGPLVPPAITISGRVTLGSGSGADAITVNESLQFDDNVNWTKGSHTVKAGFQLLKLRYLNRGSFQTMGTFTFSGYATGNAAADFVLGKAESMTVASPLLEQAGLQTSTYYFVQDDWRIHPRLTLNLGLRYELAMPWVHPQDFWGTVRLGQQSQVIKTAPLGMAFPGDPGVPRGLVATDRNNFAPRVGFAWDPFGRGRTSVRGAYGIFYEAVNADIIQNTSQPFRYTVNINAPQSLVDPLAGQPPIPLSVNMQNPAFVGVQTLFYPDSSLRTPYVQHYNLNLQHEVVKDLSVQVAYVGKGGRKLLMGLTTNPGLAVPGIPLTAATLNQRRPIQPFGQLDKISSMANSRYNAMQMEVNKRFGGGFSLKGIYTFSRSIDMASGTSLGAGVPYIFNLRTQIGVSDFQAKHIASFSWIWNLPGLKAAPAPVRGLLGNWQANGLVTTRSGLPVNIVIGRDTALSGTTNQRPNVVGEHRLSGDRPRAEKILAWYNRAAFAEPRAGAYGDVGRNALVGTPSLNTNFALFKNVPLPGREGLRLQLRSEFFNVFNAVNLGNPNNQFTAGANMGRITGAGEARVIQFALKLIF